MASLELKQEIQEALKNTTLSRTLGNFCATYPAKREKSYAGVDFEATRNSIKEVKSYAAEHIDELVDEFTKNCTARGGHVFRAKSTEEAMDWIRNLVKEKGVKTIVKSKSMASEEIHMNKTLASDGVLVIKVKNTPSEPDVPVLDNETHVAYIAGYEDGTVHPNGQITRAEVATILYRLLTDASRAVFGTSVNSFSDVPANEWFNTAVSTLANAKVLAGYPDGTFRPNAPITRAELATVLTRLSVLVDLSREITPASFNDVDDHWAVSFIRTAANNGWINGYLETLPEAGMKTFSDNMDPTMWYYIAIQEAANGHDYTRGADGIEVWAEPAA